MLVVGSLRRFQGAVQVDGQGIVQLGLCLFRQPARRREIYPARSAPADGWGEGLHQRMSGKKSLAAARSALRRCPPPFAAPSHRKRSVFRIRAGRRRSVPRRCGRLPHAASRTSSSLYSCCKSGFSRHSASFAACSPPPRGRRSGGAGVPQSGKFFQRCAAQRVWYWLYGGFQVLLCLCGGAHLLGRGVHLPCQCPGAGAAGFKPI